MMLKCAKFLVVAMVILFIAVGCSSEDTPGPVESTTIGESGGTAQSEDGQVQIVFPEGAVGEDAEVTIQKLATPDRDDLRTGLYEFGITTDLLADVTVSITLNNADGEIVMARYSGGDIDPVAGSRVDSGKVVAELSSFSAYGGFDLSAGGESPGGLDPSGFNFDLVADLHEGSNSHPEPLAVVGGKFYFGADDGLGSGSRNKLWVSDGTAANTELVPPFADSVLSTVDNPELPAIVFGDRLIVTTRQGLVSTNGTDTHRVFEISPKEMIEFQGEIVFAASSSDPSEPDLWISDGTAAGTEGLSVINDGGDARVREFTIVNDKLFFTAEDETNGRQIWVTDGSDAGTLRLTDFPASSSGPDHLAAFGDELVFNANDGINNHQMWFSDGTEAGTRMVLVADLPDSMWGSVPKDFVDMGGTMLFNATSTGLTPDTELWISDGTEAGTEVLHDVRPEGDHYVLTPDGRLFFGARHSSHSGRELWVTDGTEGGTRLVADINPADSSTPEEFSYFDGLVYFRADDGVHGTQLWVTDGTSSGTIMIRPQGSTEEDSVKHSFTDFSILEFEGALYFPAAYNDAGNELWRLQRSN